MMKQTKMRRFRFLLAAALFLTAGLIPAAAGAEEAGETQSLPFRDLTADEIVSEMGLGWNLGNTMDGHSGFMPSETAWQSVVTTQKLIDAVHDAGFNTVRIPVTWGLKIDDENEYTIDSVWLSRVREIADYAVSQDMYVIINIHHDGAEQTGWLRVAAEGEELELVKAKFKRVWEQIATEFIGYDEHVIFESMNEVKSDDDTQDGIKRDFSVINELNQIFVNAVRSTGGNNTRRWLLVPGRYTNIVNTTNESYGFTMPRDPWNAENRLMLSVHDYDYGFGLLSTMGVTNWSEDSAAKMARNFQKLIDQFTSQGIPVVLGEYGAVNKNNTENRAYYYEAIVRLSRLSGVVCCAWDIGWYDSSLDPDYTFSLFDRESGELLYPEIVQAMLRGYYGAEMSAGLKDYKNVVHGTADDPVETVAIQVITLDTDALALAAGSFARVSAATLPAEANEPVLYKTSDASVATVYNGLIRAHGIGRCVITAYSLGGDATAEIAVTVYPDEALALPITAIETDADAYSVYVGETRQIRLSLPAGTNDTVRFVSSDADVAAVSPLGVLTGKSAGTAFITLSARSGAAKTVRVDVAEPVSDEDALDLAIYVYYNDDAHLFYSNCQGETVRAVGNGTYTLTFDCGEHLSDDAVKAGVRSLAGTGAIYIADVKAANGTLSSCSIFYDEILLDGVPLTVTQTEPKSALKTGDRFDTNDPVNAWEGSAVAEATATDYVISFTGNAEPQTITVTFTLSDFVLAKDAEREPEAAPVPAEIVLSAKSVLLETADPLDVTFTLTPEDTTDTASLSTSDASVVWVSPLSAAPGKDGAVTVSLVPIGLGEASVTVLTQSGAAQTFTVTVTAARPATGGTADVYLAPSDYVPISATAAPEATETPAATATPAVTAEPAAQTGGTGSVLLFAALGAVGGLVVLGAILLTLRAVAKKKGK